MVQPSSLVESFKHLSCMLLDKVQLLMCAKPTSWKSSKGPSQLYESGVANWQWGKWFGSITCFWSHVSWLTEKMLGGDHMHALPKVHWPPLCTSAPAAFASVLCMLSTLVMAFGLGHRHWWFWSNTSACMVGMKLICQNDTKLLGWTSMHGAAQTDYSTLVLMWECKQLCWIECLIFSLHWFSSTTKAQSVCLFPKRMHQCARGPCWTPCKGMECSLVKKKSPSSCKQKLSSNILFRSVLQHVLQSSPWLICAGSCCHCMVVWRDGPLCWQSPWR